MASHLPCGNDTCLLARLPERLLVMGYRHWLAGYETGSIEPWEMAWSLFSCELGPADGRASIAVLADWVRELRQRPAGGPCFFPHSCRWLCRDECFVLSTIAALQHGDETTATVSLGALLEPDHIPKARTVAKGLAEQFFKVGQVLLPVPASVIEEIASRPPREAYH